MHKVVIIDDEPIIVEGISKLVPWEKYHCAVAGTAGNGREGLEVIRKISILTGYRNFDYCQEAIRLGVSRFLLKPSNMDEIEEAVEAMAERISRENSKEMLEEEKLAGSFIVKNALQYMEEHYQEKITLGLVAEKTYVSQWHLSKLLNRHQEKSFSELLNQIRISHAKELLKNPCYRIADISEMVGFTDVAYFSKVFKKLEGISANEFRNTRI